MSDKNIDCVIEQQWPMLNGVDEKGLDHAALEAVFSPGGHRGPSDEVMKGR